MAKGTGRAVFNLTTVNDGCQDEAVVTQVADVAYGSTIGIGGASRLRPSHTTVRTGPYTAVREVTLTRFDQMIRLVLAGPFGVIHRRERFDVFPQRLPGFTRRRR